MATHQRNATYLSLSERYQWEGQPTKHTCDVCGEDIYWHEITVAICVSFCEAENGRIEYTPVQESPNTLLVPPLLIHKDCWDQAYEAMRIIAADTRPVSAPEELLDCMFCKSSIMNNENMGALYEGKFGTGKLGDPAFVYTDKHVGAICITCLNELGEQVGQSDWANLTEIEECSTCRRMRCWRTEGCSCECHYGEIEEHDRYYFDPDE